MAHMLLEAINYGSQPVPDFDIVINTADHPLVPLAAAHRRLQTTPPPIFSIATTASHADLPWPCFSFWDWREAGVAPWSEQAEEMLRAASAFEFAHRAPQAFWRGSDNGKYIDAAGQLQGKRRPLVALSQEHPFEVNAKFTRSTSPLGLVSLPDHCRYSYLVNVGGATYSARLKYLLLCGSAVVQVEDAYFEFYQPLLTSGKHYLASGPSKAALHDTLTHARAKPQRSASIGSAGQAFVTECLRMADVYLYMRTMLEVYSAALSDPKAIRAAPGAVQIRSHAQIDSLGL